jgi:chromosomal replication initiation ATPase DnaA
MQSAGIDLSAVIAAACRYLAIEGKELARPNRRFEIARACALISYVATQSLPISGSKVARRFNVDRSAISRATPRVSQDPELPAATKTIQRELEKINIECPLFTPVSNKVIHPLPRNYPH